MGGRPLADCGEVIEFKIEKLCQKEVFSLHELAENIAEGDGDGADKKKEEKRPEQETMGLFRFCGG
jgi:hypothetical protein